MHTVSPFPNSGKPKTLGSAPPPLTSPEGWPRVMMRRGSDYMRVKTTVETPERRRMTSENALESACEVKQA
ncbi:hypothetical protein C8T65DRAFT_686870 [Cerioporus squamosus]|nr:hypothetical protein C8T65DRAFT_686870 [Cerioporus squamosus]